MQEDRGAFYSLFTHRGRVHLQFPKRWVEEPPLYAYGNDPRNGPVAMIYFPAVGAAYRIYEDWSGSSAGFVQPLPIVEKFDPAEVAWGTKAPRIFEPLDAVRLFGGSNEPILLGEV